MDRGAWLAKVHGVAKSRTRQERPSTHTCMAQEPHQTSQAHVHGVEGKAPCNPPCWGQATAGRKLTCIWAQETTKDLRVGSIRDLDIS